MPARSQAQLALAHEVLAGKSNRLPIDVAQQIVDETPHGHKLPARVGHKAHARGRQKNAPKTSPRTRWPEGWR